MGGEWTSYAPSGRSDAASFNVEGEQIMGLSSIHLATIPSKNLVRLGYFTVPVSGVGLLSQSQAMSVEVVVIESDTRNAEQSNNVRTAKRAFDSVASKALVHIGMPSRRRALSSGRWEWIGPPVPKVRPARKRDLSSCDPCAAKIWGDVNGDCEFDASDAAEAQTFATGFSSFSTGASSTNTLSTFVNSNGYSCDWVKEQLNPTLDLHNENFGGDDTSDPRYGQPYISVADVIHLNRATQYQHRFIQPGQGEQKLDPRRRIQPQ